MKTKSQGLKLLAQIAKQRLRGEVGLISQPKFTTMKENVKLLSTDDDDKLYKQICSILSENKDIINPIGKLIDYKRCNNFTKLEREKYFFDLIDKYSEFKTKFEKENTMVM